MKRLLLSATAVLTLVACSEIDPVSPTRELSPTPPNFAVAPVGPRWNIFTSQTPEATLDATPGWEVATRFRTSKAGKIVGFRFWRADGETGTNSAKLWSPTGSRLASANFPSSGTGWQTVMLTTPVRPTVNSSYRVSVNTNTAQVKAFGTFTSSSMINGPLTADLSYYGQPTGSMPTVSSVSSYFVDVIFEEDVPLPNLYVASDQPGYNFSGQQIVTIQICNNGAAIAAASTTQFAHWVSGWVDPNVPGRWQTITTFPTPSLVPGGCYTKELLETTPDGTHNEYHVWADVNDVVYESNEGDNRFIWSINLNGRL